MRVLVETVMYFRRHFVFASHASGEWILA